MPAATSRSPGLTIDGESNPFLGLSRHPPLAGAARRVPGAASGAVRARRCTGALKVMLPMVTVPAELEACGGHARRGVRGARAAGIACARPPLGIMVEVPAAALCVEDFDAAFYSIGSNDLTQYTMAAARDIGAVADLNDAAQSGGAGADRPDRRGRPQARCRGLALRRRGRRHPPDDGAARDRADARLSVAPVTVARLKAAIAKVTGPHDATMQADRRPRRLATAIVADYKRHPAAGARQPAVRDHGSSLRRRWARTAPS